MPRSYLVRLVTVLVLESALAFVLAYMNANGKGLFFVERDAERILASCRDRENREACYIAAFNELTEKTDLERAFKVLAAVQARDDQANDCHYIAHGIGITETKKNPANWQRIAGERCFEGCFYGCLHGALDEYMSEVKHALTPEVVREVCAGVTRGTCTHHLGHVILVETGRNVPEALELCRVLDNEDRRYRCEAGVFMEEIVAANLKRHGLGKPSDGDLAARVPELEPLCNSFSGELRRACWQEMPHAIIAKTNADPASSFAYCERAPDQLARADCLRHTIVLLVGLSLQSGVRGYLADLQKVGTICDALAPFSPQHGAEFKNDCYAILAAEVIAGVPGKAPEAAKFCATLEPVYRASCFSLMKWELNVLNMGSSADDACRAVPEGIQELCRTAQAQGRREFFNEGSPALDSP